MNHYVIPSVALLAALAVPSGFAVAQTADALPAWSAFKEKVETIKDYTETLTAHEIKGTNVEDRVYHFSFAKPAFARSAIVSGPGHGSEAVWTGGDTVRGHQGGFVSFVKLTLSVHDARATDIRGKTISGAFYPSMIAEIEGAGGKITEEPGPTIDGAPTDDVVLVPADPSKLRGLTKNVLVISRTTHLPVEHLGYEGTQLVEDEKFTDIKINPGLPPSTFTM